MKDEERRPPWSRARRRRRDDGPLAEEQLAELEGGTCQDAEGGRLLWSKSLLQVTTSLAASSRLLRADPPHLGAERARAARDFGPGPSLQVVLWSEEKNGCP